MKLQWKLDTIKNCKYLQCSRIKIGPSLVKIKSSTPKPYYFSEVLSFCLWQEITFFEKKPLKIENVTSKKKCRVCEKMSCEESKIIADISDIR